MKTERDEKMKTKRCLIMQEHEVRLALKEYFLNLVADMAEDIVVKGENGVIPEIICRKGIDNLSSEELVLISMYGWTSLTLDNYNTAHKKAPAVAILMFSDFGTGGQGRSYLLTPDDLFLSDFK